MLLDEALPRSHLAREAELLLDPSLSGDRGQDVTDTRRLALGAHAATRFRTPVDTCQTVEAATRDASRSSVVVVVTNACGRAPIRRTRWARRSGSSSLKTSSSRSSGGRPAAAA